MSLMYILRSTAEKIYMFFDTYPLWVGQLVNGVFFGILGGLLLYLLTFPYVFYSLVGAFIGLWLLSYSKIVFFHSQNFRQIMGIESSNMNQFIDSLKMFFEHNMIEIIVAVVVSLALFKLITRK